jgi:hypothetical protein
MGKNWWIVLGLAVALGAGFACGSDKSGGAPSYAGKEDSVMVTAGKAAALTLGAVKLDVPEGAVSEDKEIKVKVNSKSGQPDEKKIAIDVYDFGPDGTKFDTSVKLEFDLSGVNVGKGHKAVVAWLDNDKWVSIPTAVKNGKASAETDHFTPYTVLVVPDGSSGQTSNGVCSTTFEPCGGDLVGTWEYTSGCLGDALNPFAGDAGSPFPECDDAPTTKFNFDVTGTASFGADGSFSDERTQTFSIGYTLSASCISQINRQSGASLSCSELGGTAQGSSCFIGSSDDTPTTDSTVGTYTIDGDSLTVIEEGSDTGDAQQYCVNGDKLTVAITDPSVGTVLFYTATRSK